MGGNRDARWLHRPILGLRGRPVFGAFGLRPAIAQLTLVESELLGRYAQGVRVAVELGVAEGCSAAIIRQVMADDGVLYLVDPYPRGRFNVSFTWWVAKRQVARVGHAEVRWIRRTSHEAADGWSEEIEFLFIDADHSYERVAADWACWAPHVAVGGVVALHDALVFEGGWTTTADGPVRLVAEVAGDAASWQMVDSADSLAILRRRI